MSVQHLDTINFPDALEAIKTMADDMQNLVEDLDDYKAELIENWVGEGRNEFEKMYRVIRRKLDDGKDITWDMYEKLIAAQQIFIQQDVDVAKSMEGITKV